MSQENPCGITLLSWRKRETGVLRTLRRGLGNPRSALVLLILLSLLLNVWGSWWGLIPGSPEDWGADTISPMQVFSAAHRFFSGGWHTRYPPLHYQLLTLLYSPALGLHAVGLLDVLSPDVYIVLFSLGRLLSLVMATVVVVMVYCLGRELKLGSRAAILATAIAILNPLFVFYAKTTNLEIPYTMWLLASFLYAVRAFQNRKRAAYTLFAITATLAICTKDQAYGFYVLVVPILIYNHWSGLRQAAGGPWEAGVETAKTFVLPSLVAAVLFMAIYNFPFNLEGFVAHFQLIAGPASANYRIFPNTVSGHLRMAIQSIRQAGFAQGWPLLLVSALGAIQALRRWKTNPVFLLPLVAVISYYAFFISVIGYCSDRFFLPVIILLSLYGGSWLAEFLDSRRFPTLLKRGTILAILGYSLLYTASVDALLVADSRYQAYEWMAEHVMPSDTLYGIGKPYYLPPLYMQPTTWFDSNPTLRELEQLDPNYVVVSSLSMDLFPAESETGRFFTELFEGSAGYELAVQYRGRPLFNILNRDGIFTNLDKISPEVFIFRKSLAR